MIDEKKIEEAAEKYADDATKINTGLDWYDHANYGFKEGVNWTIQEFLKDLWHPAEEAPNEAKGNILIQFKDGHFYCLDTYRMFNNTNWNSINDMWDEYNKLVEVRRYLCIDDLLSKKGGEEK